MKLEFTILIVLLAVSVHAGNNKWTTKGPFGGNFKSFAFHPTDDKLIFASGSFRSGGSVFRSRDGGNSWKRLDLSDSYYFDFPVRIHPKNPETILAGGISLSSSTDQGSTWQVISANPFGGDSLSDFEFHPANPNVIYGVTFTKGVLKSTDGGKTWTAKNAGLKINPTCDPGTCENVPQLEVDPLNGQVVYVLLASRLIFKTTNGGENWQPVSNGLNFKGAFNVGALAIDPKNSKILYAGSSNGIVKTTNGGMQWFSTNCNCGIRSLSIDPRNPQDIYTAGEVMKSTDGGGTWQRITVDPIRQGSVGVGVHPRISNFVLVGGFGQGIYRSQNGGASWQLVNKGLDSFVVEALAQRPGEFLALGAEGGPFRSTNAAKWEFYEALTEAVGDYDIFTLQVHPQNPNLLIATARGGIARSTDGGKNWEVIGYFFSHIVALDPQNQDVLYIAPRNGQNSLGVAKSTNQGRTWDLVNSGLSDRQVTALCVNPKNGAELFAGAQSGRIFKTINGGRNWKNSSSGLTESGEIRAIIVDSQNSDVIYLASAGEGLYKSTDAGRTWKHKSSQVGFAFVRPLSGSSRTLFADGFGGLAISTDAAETWTAFDSNGLGNFGVFDSLVNLSNSNLLLIGTTRGVFSYTRAASANGPVIEQLVPSAGKSGDTIAINGSNFGSFQADNKVSFSGIDAGTAQSWTDTQISVKVPSGAHTGPVTVTVAGKRSNAFEFIALPSSGNLDPASGPAAGGTRVTILAPAGLSGTQFNVLFGSTLAKDIRIIDPNIIVCTSPPGSGTVDVSITTSAISVTVGSFTYE